MSDSNQSLLADIHEINLSYLMLAQRLLRDNCAMAMALLGLDGDSAALIKQLSPAQLVRLASSNVVICSLRLNDYNLLNALTRDVLGGILQQAHSTILLTQQAFHGLEDADADTDRGAPMPELTGDAAGSHGDHDGEGGVARNEALQSA